MKSKRTTAWASFLNGQSCPTLWDHMDYIQTLLSMKYSRQEYWSGLLFSIPRHLPEPEIELVIPVSHGLLGRFYTIVPPEEPSNSLKTLQHTRQPCFLEPLSPGDVFSRLVGGRWGLKGLACLHIWSTTAIMRKLFQNTRTPYSFLALRPKVVEEHTCGDLEKA